MKPILKAYKYYRKNFHYLWEMFIAESLVGDDDCFDRMNSFVANECGVDKNEFIKIVALAYDKKINRAFK